MAKWQLGMTNPRTEPPQTEAIQVDPDLLESRLRIARLMADGPLTTEPGA